MTVNISPLLYGGLKLSAVPTVLRHLGLLPKSSNESLETEHQSTLRSAVAQRQSLNPLVIEPVHNDWAHLVSRGAEPWPPHIATKALFIWSSRQGVIDTRTSNHLADPPTTSLAG